MPLPGQPLVDLVQVIEPVVENAAENLAWRVRVPAARRPGWATVCELREDVRGHHRRNLDVRRVFREPREVDSRLGVGRLDVRDRIVRSGHERPCRNQARRGRSCEGQLSEPPRARRG